MGVTDHGIDFKQGMMHGFKVTLSFIFWQS
ncbi:hypothetical protein N836_31845 [Leptolyngbya sp. Heron Island J]|nr:hypothetical protein N836_31845 [Leptolyngbya sp. Heron Island J]